MKRSPMPRRSEPMKRAAMKAGKRIAAKPKRNPMTEAQRAAVLNRDNHTCQAHAFGWQTEARCAGGPQVHHIVGRGLGGTSDPNAHDLDRCVTLCAVHHSEVESRRTDAYGCGLAERRNTA